MAIRALKWPYRPRLVFFRNQKSSKNKKCTIRFVLMSSIQKYPICRPLKKLSIETGALKCHVRNNRDFRFFPLRVVENQDILGHIGTNYHFPV